MKPVYLCLFATLFLNSASALAAANTDCMKKNFDAYMQAAEKMHASQLEKLNSQTDAVKAAVTDQVNWQLSNLALSKATFAALLAKAPELIALDVPVANIYQTYLTGYASEGCTENECNVDSAKLNGKADQALKDDAAFLAALQQNNDLTRLRMNRPDEEQKAMQVQQQAFFTPAYLTEWLASASVKTAGDIGSKTLTQLKCN
jgi:hypothetical protein